MNKTLAWILLAGVVIAGGYYTLRGDKSQPVEDKTTQEETTGKKMAFSEFAKQGGSYKCEVQQALSDFENTGTVYMNNGMMRGEFSTIAEGRTMDTTFVYKDGLMYTWSNLMPGAGFKMKANPTVSNTDASASGNYSWNTTEIGDYDCVAWAADASMFAIPTDITFKEVGDK